MMRALRPLLLGGLAAVGAFTVAAARRRRELGRVLGLGAVRNDAAVGTVPRAPRPVGAPAASPPCPSRPASPGSPAPRSNTPSSAGYPSQSQRRQRARDLNPRRTPQGRSPLPVAARLRPEVSRDASVSPSLAEPLPRGGEPSPPRGRSPYTQEPAALGAAGPVSSDLRPAPYRRTRSQGSRIVMCLSPVSCTLGKVCQVGSGCSRCSYRQRSQRWVAVVTRSWHTMQT
jgi:hypothetical protein